MIKIIQKDIILVCTQVIEAGVDIDMDLGFKDYSIFESEEQFMGRVNRSSLRPFVKCFSFQWIMNMKYTKMILG